MQNIKTGILNYSKKYRDKYSNTIYIPAILKKWLDWTDTKDVSFVVEGKTLIISA